jgi:flagellar biosynthetic protein FliP
MHRIPTAVPAAEFGPWFGAVLAVLKWRAWLPALTWVGTLWLALLLPAAAVPADASPAASASASTASASHQVLRAPGITLELGNGADVAPALKIILLLTVLSLAPAILMSMTAFIRIVVVLSMLRSALGMQETPPNTVIISLALFLTFFTMAPTLQSINQDALQPFLDGKISIATAGESGAKPLREFMVRQTREKDLALMVELSKSEAPNSIDDIRMVQLVPAFMLSELRSAFQIGFVIFLPFLLVDLIVSSALLALGMMMVPPTSISLPIKILLFVLIDGWNLVVRALLGTFS